MLTCTMYILTTGVKCCKNVNVGNVFDSGAKVVSRDVIYSFRYTVITRFTVPLGGKRNCTVNGGHGKSGDRKSGPKITTKMSK